MKDTGWGAVEGFQRTVHVSGMINEMQEKRLKKQLLEGDDAVPDFRRFLLCCVL